MLVCSVAGQGVQGVDHTRPRSSMALLEHGRVAVVPVRVAPLVALDVSADYGGGRCRNRRLAERVGRVSGDTGVLLGQGPAGGRNGRRHGRGHRVL